MADDVPVCDVLCEAMEYLSKLGSNLRARSENLKEKRIRKDKLKNYHAVQKAADKVLLICELSKKSLENVECGVRKVLTLMSSNQLSGQPGVEAETATSPKPSTVEDTDKYRYFKYRSYKLKVAKKVPVKHYTSVRVLARNISMSMLDKYPVYHNCKLYRARKRREKDRLRKSMEKDKCNKVDKSDNILEQENTEDNQDPKMDTDALENDNSSECDNPDKDERDAEKRTDRKTSQLSDCNKKTLEKIKVQETESNGNDLNDKTLNLESSSNIDKKVEENVSRPNRKSKDDNASGTEEGFKKCRSSKSNYRKIQVIDDDSSDDEVQKSSQEDKEISHNDSKNEHSSNKPENVTEESVSSHDSPSDTHKSKKLKLDSSDTDQGPSNKEETINTCENFIATETAPVKPLIKCVNINKLLKPDIVQNIVDSPEKSSTSKKSIITAHKECLGNKENVNNHSKKTKDDEEFWKQKRKEVSAFVSKKFNITLSRLPELSEQFLCLHKLIRIVQSERVICELANRNSEAKNFEMEASSKMKNAPANTMNVVKNALLNDSDSDKSDVSISKSPLPLAEIEKTVQSALLNDADPSLLSFVEINKTIQKVLNQCGDGNDKNKSNSTKNVKDALLNDSDSGSEMKQSGEKSVVNNSELKKALLTESDMETNEHDKTQASSKDCGDSKNGANDKNVYDTSRPESNMDSNVQKPTQSENSPNKDAEHNKSGDDLKISPTKRKKHKRKSMMESMHAKKMLLTYSSSSDTEDEQLRNALKEIKDSLLKGVSSSDDEKNKNNAKKSSSEDEDIDLKISRKRKKDRKASSLNSSVNSDSGSKNSKKDSDQVSKRSRKSEVNSDTQSKSSRKKVRFE